MPAVDWEAFTNDDQVAGSVEDAEPPKTARASCVRCDVRNDHARSVRHELHDHGAALSKGSFAEIWRTVPEAAET